MLRGRFSCDFFCAGVMKFDKQNIWHDGLQRHGAGESEVGARMVAGATGLVREESFIFRTKPSYVVNATTKFYR